MKAVLWVVASLLAGSAVAREGTLTTLAGERLTGNVTLLNDGISVHPKEGEPREIPLTNLADLEFTAVAKAHGETPATSNTVVRAQLPGAWESRQVGSGLPGELSVEASSLLIRGAGQGLPGAEDAFLFVHRSLEGNGHVVARIESFEGEQPEAVAGLMLRDTLGDASAYAFVGVRGTNGVTVQYRTMAGTTATRMTNTAFRPPCWLRLQRFGGRIDAEASSDGQKWTPVGIAPVNLGQTAKAGFTLASGSEEEPVTARFSQEVVGTGGLSFAPSRGFPRLLLRGGSIVIAPIEAADESIVRLGGDFRARTLSTLNLARVEFVPLSPDFNSRLDPDRAGVLLVDGDFLDGRLRALATNTITMSSLLFGFRRFAIGSEAAAVQLRAVEKDQAQFAIRSTNGSQLFARTLTLEEGGLRAESPLLGSVWLNLDEVSAVQRVAGMPES